MRRPSYDELCQRADDDWSEGITRTPYVPKYGPPDLRPVYNMPPSIFGDPLQRALARELRKAGIR